MCFSKHLIYAEIYTDFVLGVWLEMHRYRISRLILTDLLVVTDNIIITNLKNVTIGEQDYFYNTTPMFRTFTIPFLKFIVNLFVPNLVYLLSFFIQSHEDKYSN